MHLFFTTGVYQSRVENNRLNNIPWEQTFISFQVTCDWLGFNEDIHKKTRHDFILRIVFNIKEVNLLICVKKVSKKLTPSSTS